MCNDRGSINIYISIYFLCRVGLTYLIPYVRHTHTHTHICHHQKGREFWILLPLYFHHMVTYPLVLMITNLGLYIYTFLCVCMCVCVLLTYVLQIKRRTFWWRYSTYFVDQWVQDIKRLFHIICNFFRFLKICQKPWTHNFYTSLVD